MAKIVATVSVLVTWPVVVVGIWQVYKNMILKLAYEMLSNLCSNRQPSQKEIITSTLLAIQPSNFTQLP